jgi:adenylate kinase family enzyme
MKIYISGAPGSGKTFLSDRISDFLKIKRLELDDIVWDNSYRERKIEDRDKMLDDFLNKNKSWIIEGVYFEWLSNLFGEADFIIILDINLIIRDYRIIKRFFMNKFTRTNLKKEGIKNLMHMLHWNHQYEKVIKKDLLTFLEKYRAKVMFVTDIKKINPTDFYTVS